MVVLQLNIPDTLKHIKTFAVKRLGGVNSLESEVSFICVIVCTVVVGFR